MIHDIRPIVAGDIPGLKLVLEETGLFPAQLLDDMMQPMLDGSADAIWITCQGSNGPVGFAFAQPEALTEGTWNMLAIAVLPQNQRSGVGGALVAATESALRARDQRLLIVDTSGTQAFAGVCGFYRKAGYDEEARIRDFWATGDDKITFRKAL